MTRFIHWGFSNVVYLDILRMHLFIPHNKAAFAGYKWEYVISKISWNGEPTRMYENCAKLFN